MMNKAQVPQHHNYCRDLAIAAMQNLYCNRGVLNESVLIFDAFMIFFANYFCDTYVHEALDALKNSKLYRQRTKQLTDKAQLQYVDLNKKMTTRFGEYSDIMAQVNLDIGEAFEDRMKQLGEAMEKVIRQHTSQEVETKTRVAIAVIVLEFATQNYKDRMAEASPSNPIIKELHIINHEPLLKLMTSIYETIGVPAPVERDLTVLDIWQRINKQWLDPEFIASNIQTIEGASDEEAQELRDAIRGKPSAKT